MKPPLFGLLLAGGRSTRMGHDKASMVIGADGLNQAQRAVQELSAFCQKVFLSLRDGQTAPEGCEHFEIVRDNPKLSGPLAGILAAFKQEPDAAWLVMACDLPFVTPEVLHKLVHARTDGANFIAYASATDELPEPLCAIYEPYARAILQRHADRNHLCPRHIMIEERATLLELPPSCRRALENMNTPQDIAAATGEKQIQIGWFGALAEERGCREETVVTSAQTAGAFLAEIANTHNLSGLRGHVRIAVNDEFAQPDHPLRAGDKVVFLRPFSGG
jgi:molybdopterin-guanine dinucleotide biosynthesis protein A/molybdopterin converting factor small subunit